MPKRHAYADNLTLVSNFHEGKLEPLKEALEFKRCRAAMGIGGSIRQCRRKCCPMLVLRRQKKFSHMRSFFSGFTVLLIIPERFNLV